MSQLELAEQRGVVGQLSPLAAAQTLTREWADTPIINPVDRQQRCPYRECARVASLLLYKQFLQPEIAVQMALGAPAPVIEVAGDNHRFIARYMVIDTLGERAQLFAAFLLQ